MTTLSANRVSTSAIGVMIVGCLGMTASAVVAGTQFRQLHATSSPFAVVNHPAFNSVQFPQPGDFHFGGWDFSNEPFNERLARYGHLPKKVVAASHGLAVAQYPGIFTELDFPPTDYSFATPAHDPIKAVGQLSNDIAGFKRRTGVDEIFVVYLGSPSRTPDAADFDRTDLLGTDNSVPVPSAVLYATAALQSGAHFIDFTPSHTLEYQFLYQLAKDAGVQLAGRDGSTGQTMMKAHLAELFAWRGLPIRAWYSTNILGNHDGFVLSHTDFSQAKYRDKEAALTLDREQHRVSIEYVEEWGDRKEAWDAIELQTWLGSPLSVRIDWRGSDSELAAPLVMDILSFMTVSAREGCRGLQPQLAFFFKNPIGSAEASLSARWQRLVDHYSV